MFGWFGDFFEGGEFDVLVFLGFLFDSDLLV